MPASEVSANEEPGEVESDPSETGIEPAGAEPETAPDDLPEAFQRNKAGPAPEAELPPEPAPVEEFVEPAAGEPYWKEERDDMIQPEDNPKEPPLSAWESSLIEAKTETGEEEAEAAPEAESEGGEEEFRWPTVDDVMRESAAAGRPVEDSAKAAGADPSMPESARSSEAPGVPVAASTTSDRSEPMANEKTANPATGGDLQSVQEMLQRVFTDLEKMRGSGASPMLDGLARSAETLEARHRRVMDLLRMNEGLARETKIVTTSVEKRQDVKKEYEGQISELKSINEQLTSTGSRLETEKQNLVAEKNRASEDNSSLKSEAKSLAEDIDKLATEREMLEKETIDLDKERNQLEDDVRRLTRLKEEYLANVARFRDEN